MSTRELRRVEVMGRVQRGELKLGEAAELLELSYRQVKRLKKRYQAGGAKALVHHSVGRSSNPFSTRHRQRRRHAIAGVTKRGFEQPSRIVLPRHVSRIARLWKKQAPCAHIQSKVIPYQRQPHGGPPE